MRVLRLQEVQARLAAVSDSAIYRLVRAGDLPPPIKINGRTSGWPEDEIDAFIKRRVELRDKEIERDKMAIKLYAESVEYHKNKKNSGE